MSKAEERALEKYPYKEGYDVELPYPSTYDENEDQREAYIEGYHQAKKDLELSWEDINIILDIENDIIRECNSQKELVIETYPKGEDYYGEILKRFKQLKPDCS